MIDTVDPSIVDAVDGKAYQAVAASAALAIQDAVDALRHTTAIATTASGIALSQFLASGDERYLTALPALQQMVAGAVGDFAAVGEAAAKIVSEFPSGCRPDRAAGPTREETSYGQSQAAG